MAVMQNSIVFGGVDSADYGIYIGGEGVFNAPKRDAEMISIPGRNGAFVLDKGRFENIEVKYSAFNYEPDLATFSANLEAFRNAICSKRGYQRLTDTFHTDEYRMAAYIGGLEIDPVDYNTASTFTITFNCMPQRYLTSGEEAITVADGETITNPTRFEAKPMLEVEGYGTISFNNYVIELESGFLGDVVLAQSSTITPTPGKLNYETRIPINDVVLNAGDAFSVGFKYIRWEPLLHNWYFDYPFAGQTVTDTQSEATTTWDAGQFLPTQPYNQGGGWQAYYNYRTVIEGVSFEKGTSKTWTNAATTAITPVVHTTNFAKKNISLTFTTTLSYDGTSPEIVLSLGISISDASVPLAESSGWDSISETKYTDITGSSTISQLGDPTYIDCDMGVAYKIIDETVVSLNQYIDLGSDLPKLAPGNNVISYDDTVTELNVVPRWWKV